MSYLTLIIVYNGHGILMLFKTRMNIVKWLQQKFAFLEFITSSISHYYVDYSQWHKHIIILYMNI